MSSFVDLMRRLGEKCQKALYQHAVKQVLKTPPVKVGDVPFVALSMVHQRDVLPYLAAIKSFALYAKPSRVVVVCDPSIDANDRRVFKEHVPHIELRDAAEFRLEGLPVGGCWERLTAISEYVQHAYTVQLDADTLTFAPVPEVIDAVQRDVGFVIGERAAQPILSLSETAAYAKDWSDRHIQAFAEKRMDQAQLDLGLYVRGCAGFTGFPVDPHMREKMLAFSRKMQALCGKRWVEWGTEQITSNYLVANAQGSSVLPFPAYRTPDGSVSDVRFAHFIGYVRFVNGLYRQATRQIIETLRSEAGVR